MELIYNEDNGMWEDLEKPFAVVEFSTVEDYDRFVDMVEFWKEYHIEGDNKRFVSDFYCSNCRARIYGKQYKDNINEVEATI